MVGLRTALVVHVPLVAALAAIAPGQQESTWSRTVTGDFRDVVVTTGGKEIRGRVVSRYSPKEVMLLRDGKRVRIPARDVQSMITVNDQLREFFARQTDPQAKPTHAWVLAEWAQTKGLEAMARLQAIRVLSAHPDFEPAHEFLGHKKSGDQWRWRRDDSFFSREKFEEYTAEWGHPLILPSEHFVLRTTVPLDRAVDTLFDLERLYLWWFEEFGKALELDEVVEPMDVYVHKDRSSFPAWTGEGLPYYWPQPNGDITYTYYETGAPRARMLFQLGTQQILYNALADGYSAMEASTKERYAAWVEVGLGSWAETAFGGPPGRAAAIAPALDKEAAKFVLEGNRLRLPNLLGLRYDMFHNISDETPVYWAQVHTFVHFLMADSQHRPALLRFLRLALAEGKGSSSSLFDKVFEQKIERLERPWLEWLEQQTGMRAARRRR
jgi:hypothetical protein